jgi:hypothetical protein
VVLGCEGKKAVEYLTDKNGDGVIDERDKWN